MCLIAVKTTPSETFNYDAFLTAAQRNSDGTGIMYPKEGRIIHRKLGGKLSEQDNKSLYDEFIAQPRAALHVRFTTHGKTDDDNAHPFEILSIDKGDPVDLFMMHNGVISNAPKVKDGMSDTWHFVEFMLKPMLKADPYILVNPYIKAMIKDFIGACRLAFMYGDGTTVLVEDSQCNRDPKYGGVWLSNRSYLTPSTITTPSKNTVNNSNKFQGRRAYGYDWYDENDYSGGAAEKVADNPSANKATGSSEVSKANEKASVSGGTANSSTPSVESNDTSAEATGTKGQVIQKSALPSEVISSFTSLMLDATTLHDILEIITYHSNDDLETIVKHDGKLTVELLQMLKELYEDGHWLKENS